MACFEGPNIPSDGLVSFFDAGNPKSYPGSGFSWFDLGGTGAAMSLGSGTSYSSSFGGILSFTKDANGYARLENQYLDLRSSNNTVVTFTRKTVAGDNGRILTAYGNNWLLGHHDNTYGDYYAEGWVNNISDPISDTTWRMYTGTGNISTDVWQLYINGTLTTSNDQGSQGPWGWNINNQYSQHSQSQIAMVACWNRVLTSTEISQIFYNYRNRFGI